MKRCPECRRDYYDDSLLYCLDDGAALLEGPLTGPTSRDNAATLILADPEAPTEIDKPIHIQIADPPRTSPTGVRPRRWLTAPVTIVGILVVIAAAAATGLFFYPRAFESEPITSIAVLPFENGGGDPAMDYLSDGLSESLIDKLSQLPQIKVIARSSSFKFRGPNIDASEAGKKLAAHALVMGKVYKHDDQLIVRVEMVDARDNKQLWGERYVRRAADAMAIQQEIAQTVSNKLRLQLTGQQEKDLVRVGTSNPAAYESYLKGLFHRSKSGTDHLRASNAHFLAATVSDPSYASAHAHLAISYLILSGGGAMDPTEGLPKAENAALRAMALDPTIAESHLALAGIHRDRWQWKESEREYQIAVGLNPNMAEAHRRYSQLLSILARHDEAIPKAIAARDLDPLSARLNSYVAYAYYFARRYDEGIVAAHKALEIDPNFGFAYVLLGYIYSGNGQPREAIDAFNKAIELDSGGTSTEIFLGVAYVHAGEKAKALEILESLRRSDDYVSPGELAALLTALELKDEAISMLEKGYAAHDLQLQYIYIDPSFDPIRDDPRFKDIVRRVGFSR